MCFRQGGIPHTIAPFFYQHRKSLFASLVASPYFAKVSLKFRKLGWLSTMLVITSLLKYLTNNNNKACG